MRWYLKSAGYKVLSALPGGESLYRFAQNNITKTSYATRGRVEQKVEVGLKYWNWLQANGYAEKLRAGTLLDFGAGWHPTIPLLFHALGVKRQFLLDLTPWFQVDSMRETVRILREVISAPGFPAQAEVHRLPEWPQDAADIATALQSWGISYYAPYATRLGTLAGQADVAFSTQVLLYISPEGLRSCFAALKQCLKPGGIFMGTIYLMDLYAHSDPRITAYNHLKFSNEFWGRWVNSAIMPYNRLKARDYLELLQQSGFRVRHQHVDPPTPEDYAALDSVAVHPAFQRYSRDELVAKNLFFAAERV